MELTFQLTFRTCQKPTLGDLKDWKASEVSGSVLNIGRTAEGSSLAQVLTHASRQIVRLEILKIIHQSINIHELVEYLSDFSNKTLFFDLVSSHFFALRC